MLKQILKIDKDANIIIGSLFAYLFGRINKSEYKEAIGDKEEARRIWRLAKDNGYILKNCKLFAYSVHVNRKAGLSTSPAKFGIYNEDVSILRKLNLNHLADFKSYSLFDFDNLEGAILKSEDLQTFTGKFVSKKMMFLIRSYGLTREDIYSDMQNAALYAIRKQYPDFKSELHVLNICKRTIHNAGIGLIEFWTRDKRQALILDQGVHQAVNVPLSAIPDVAVSPEHENELRLNIQSLVALAPEMKPRAREFVQAAAGLYDPGFTLYIGVDNREAVEHWEYSRYLASLREYLKVNEEQTKKLFSNLKRRLQ